MINQIIRSFLFLDNKDWTKNIIDIVDIIDIIVEGLQNSGKVKIHNFGTFIIKNKKSRIGRNPKTKEKKVISSRDVVLFKPSKEFKEFVNSKDNG